MCFLIAWNSSHSHLMWSAVEPVLCNNYILCPHLCCNWRFRIWLKRLPSWTRQPILVTFAQGFAWLADISNYFKHPFGNQATGIPYHSVRPPCCWCQLDDGFEVLDWLSMSMPGSLLCHIFTYLSMAIPCQHDSMGNPIGPNACISQSQFWW